MKTITLSDEHYDALVRQEEWLLGVCNDLLNNHNWVESTTEYRPEKLAKTQQSKARHEAILAELTEAKELI